MIGDYCSNARGTAGIQLAFGRLFFATKMAGSTADLHQELACQFSDSIQNCIVALEWLSKHSHASRTNQPTGGGIFPSSYQNGAEV